MGEMGKAGEGRADHSHIEIGPQTPFGRGLFFSSFSLLWWGFVVVGLEFGSDLARLRQ